MFKKRVIAYYLPQFHQIPENDKWWGVGYTEWTAIRKWKPCFSGHSIRTPQSTALGYYNLLDLSVMQSQFKVANKHNIEGFCFWTYWFGSEERLLEKPLNLLLSGPNDVKYCIAWANHSWFDKSTWTMLKQQNYLGVADYILFFNAMLPHFKNKNYILDSNRPVVSIFMVKDIPDFELFVTTWNNLAKQAGFDGIFFISDQYDPNFKYNHLLSGFSHSPEMFKNRNLFQKVLERLIRYYSWTWIGPMRYSYSKMMKNLFLDFVTVDHFIPTLFSGWDTTPRHGKRGVVLTGFDKVSFANHVKEIFSLKFNSNYIFIKSWNEWAEGNVLEPDDQFGDDLLRVIKEANQKN
ncbi:MAG: glycoside hydrolase family 99-like domain-containing protein [Pseudobdellovibrio sp.]